MRRAVVAVGVGLLVALSGCGSGQDDRVAAPCTADDFTLKGLSVEGATGALLGHVSFTRKPGRACKLHPMVRARILWSNGSLAIPVPVVDRLPGDRTPVATRAAAHVRMGFMWRNWCGRGLWGARVAGPMRLSVSFGYGGRLFEVPLRDRPRCDSRSDASRAISTRFLAADVGQA